MAIFVTGSTGYLGSYLVAGLLREHRESLNLLVRASSKQEARERLWRSLQLHFDFPEFFDYLNSRVHIFRGDLTSLRFGLPEEDYVVLADSTDSIIHCAASLNRKSEKQCLNVNLRGSLEVIQLARRVHDRKGLRRWCYPLMEGRPLEARAPRELDWSAQAARASAGPVSAPPSDPLWRSS